MKKKLLLGAMALSSLFFLSGCGTAEVEALTRETAGPLQRAVVMPLIDGITWLAELFSGGYPATGTGLGFAIIVGTILVKAAVAPLMIKSMKSTARMQEIQPQIQKLQQKYANKKDRDSQMQQQQEMMALYKEHGVNPMAGCLPMLIQMPLMIAFFQAFSKHPLIVYADSYFLGVNLGAVSALPNYILAVLVAGIMYLSQTRQQRLMQANNSNPGQPNPMKAMGLPMAVMMGMMVVFSPVAMGLYFLIAQLIMNAQTYFLKRNKKAA